MFLDYLEFYSSGNSDTPSKRANDDGTTVKKAIKIRKRTLSSSSKTDPKEFYPVKNEEDQTRILQQHSTVIPLPIVVEESATLIEKFSTEIKKSVQESNEQILNSLSYFINNSQTAQQNKVDATLAARSAQLGNFVAFQLSTFESDELFFNTQNKIIAVIQEA